MSSLFAILMLLGVIAYIGEMILNPEDHVVALIILAILYAIFGSFYDATGAKSDYDRKKRG